MKKFFENKKYLIIGVLALELVLLVVNALRFYRDETIQLTSDDLLVAYNDQNTGKTVYESGFYADHSNKEGSYIVSDSIKFGKGIYAVTIEYSSNANDSWHNCYSTVIPEFDTSEELTANLVNCDRISMPESKSSISFLTWVRYGTEFRVRMGPDTGAGGDGIYVLVNNVFVTYMRNRTILHETAKLLLAFLLIDLFLFWAFYRKSELVNFFKDKSIVVAGLSFIIFFSSYPLFYRKLFFGDDIFYHLRRIAFTADAIMSGQFPVHILPGWDNDYGYAAGVGYGDLLLYPSALIIIFGGTVQFAYKFYIFLTNVLTPLISYYAFKRISKNSAIGIASAVVFSLIGFRLHSVYSGATVGEFGAYCFLPMVILGLWDIYTKEKKCGYIILALGVTFTLSNHVLSTFILALVIPLFCVLFIEKTIKKEILVQLFKALGLIIVLNLHFIVPLMDYLIFQGMKGNTIFDMLWNRGQEFIKLFNHIPDASLDSGGFLGIGICGILALCVALGYIVSGCAGKRTLSYFRLILLNVLMIFLSVNSIFYYWIMENMPLLYKLLGTMQFPWHFLDVSCGLIVLLMAISLGGLAKNENRKALVAAVTSIICTTCVLQSTFLLGEVIKEGNQITMFDETALKSPFVAEFTIEGADQGITSVETDMIIRDEEIDSSASIVKRNGTTIVAQVENNTENTVTVEAPLWGYRHYVAKAGEDNLNVYTAENKKLAIDIPAFYNGQVKIYFREPFLWRLAEIISLSGFAYVIYVFVKKHNDKALEA